MDSRFEKISNLIVHENTPPNERAAALERLVSMIENGGGPITRSVRIGAMRRRSLIDEWTRLEGYAGDRTHGETISSVYRACKACAVWPLSIDLGFHGSDEAVIAIKFGRGNLPNGLDLQDAIRQDWPDARVSATSAQDADDKTYLLYLGADAASFDA